MKSSQKNGAVGASASGKAAKSSTRRKNHRAEIQKNGQPESSARFYGSALPGVKSEELSGNLIVIEGTDGSGRSTQISLLTEWLESQGFAVETMGLRRSALVGEDIDALLAENSVTRMTLALMYSTDFFDQLERRLLPALRSGLIVLADRYIFTLIARAAVRGISRDYLHGIYEMAMRPDLTFWLNVRPEVAFDREFRKSQTISYWESGRDMSLSNDLFQSFIRYQSMIKREFEYLSKRHGFIELDGEGSVSEVNRVLRKQIASHLGIPRTQYKPSHALSHLWR
ncbi:MAG: thymidylate kinase [Candidatus Acidiferrales bacterium]|jgi:dTMP kinase